MKKGFTLIELLAILAILGAVILVAVPSIVSTNKKSQENNYNQYTQNIENATEIYVEMHPDRYADLKNTNGQTVNINTEDLVASGVIQGTLTNHKTDVQLINEASYVTVTNQNGTLIYTYVAP